MSYKYTQTLRPHITDFSMSIYQSSMIVRSGNNFPFQKFPSISFVIWYSSRFGVIFRYFIFNMVRSCFLWKLSRLFSSAFVSPQVWLLLELVLLSSCIVWGEFQVLFCFSLSICHSNSWVMLLTVVYVVEYLPGHRGGILISWYFPISHSLFSTFQHCVFCLWLDCIQGMFRW